MSLEIKLGSRIVSEDSEQKVKISRKIINERKNVSARICNPS